MLDLELIPNGTKTSSSTGEAVEVSAGQSRVFIVTSQMAQTLEQQALEVVLEWSADGANWGRMAVLPQQFYRGTIEVVLDLRKLSEVRWVRARWTLERWGRGDTHTSCEFSVRMQELPVDAG